MRTNNCGIRDIWSLKTSRNICQNLKRQYKQGVLVAYLWVLMSVMMNRYGFDYSYYLVVLKSYSLYSLMSVSLNLKNLTWQRQLKAYISDWNRNQNVAKSTYLHWLLKIHILWEGQTIWKNLPYVVEINKYETEDF